jgi:hypothetical protein
LQVYVHSAPDEPATRENKVIRVPGGDKHVNILFVKTPSTDSSWQTEVILPEQDEHKNLRPPEEERGDEQRGHPTTVRPTTTETGSLLHPVRQPTSW